MVNLPEPQRDIRLYKDTLRARFSEFPEALANFNRASGAARGTRPDFLPTRLDVENVSRCNFRCTMCLVSDWKARRRAEDMGLADFKALIDRETGLLEVKVQGIGEPLLGREAFFEMIHYARAKHLWVRTTTNGSLLHVRDNARKLVESDVCEVQVSVDGASKATFEAIRRGGKFELVRDNCALLNRAYEVLTSGIPRTRMWTLVQKQNAAEFEAFIPLAVDMGFKRLTYSMALGGWGQANWEAKNNAEGVSISEADCRAAIKDGARLGLEVTFWDGSLRKYRTGNPDTLCPWPFERAFISSDMRVVPCCTIGTPEVKDMGDARKFKEVWEGEGYQKFRQAHLDGDIPRECRACYAG